jgi:transcriptional regulator with XRE-family HTH domain
MQLRQALLNLGRAIGEMREQQGFSASDMAAGAGMTPTQLAALEDASLIPTSNFWFSSQRP